MVARLLGECNGISTQKIGTNIGGVRSAEERGTSALSFAAFWLLCRVAK